MAITQKEFDEACHKFTQACQAAANWKHNYLGAAYSTRLEQACDMLENAIADMRAVLERDSA